jgi:outer membrane protein
MKKITVLLALLTATMSFAESEKENSVDLGLGVFYRNSVYKEKDRNEVLPLPVVGVRYKEFYYEAPVEMGYRFYNTENLTLTAYGRYNLYTGYKPKDMEKEFKDMDRRKDDFHLGLRGKYNFGPLGTGIISHISGDISDKSDGMLARIEINQPIKLNSRVTILPYAAVEYMSENYTDYYFGIKESEASRGINNGNSYKADDSFNFETGIRSMIKINRDFNLFLTAGYTRYGDSIGDSPLVKDRDIFTVGTGVSYSFRF